MPTYIFYVDIQTFNILRLTSKPTGPLITYVKSDFEETALKSLGHQVSYLSRSGEYSVFTLTHESKGLNLTFMATGSGSASLLTGLFEVASSNLSAIVRIGACGGLNDTEVGEIISCESSLCNDRVSSALTSSSRASGDGELITQINHKLREDQIFTRVARNVSVDAMYLFEKDVNRAEKNGASCWDLETATLFAFGERFNIKAASILEVVSDRSGHSSQSYPPLNRLDYVRSVMEALVET